MVTAVGQVYQPGP